MSRFPSKHKLQGRLAYIERWATHDLPLLKGVDEYCTSRAETRKSNLVCTRLSALDLDTRHRLIFLSYKRSIPPPEFGPSSSPCRSSFLLKASNMDAPLAPRPFKFTGREYVLPGSSRFRKIIESTPRELEERFFSYRDNETQKARLEKRAILSLAYVQYLNIAEGDRLISTGRREELLKRVS